MPSFRARIFSPSIAPPLAHLGLSSDHLVTYNIRMSAHIPTMFLMIIAASGTLALSVGVVARARDEDGLRLWTAGLALQTLTFCLFSLRGQIPDFLSVILGNTALSASHSFFLAAIGQFQQRRLSHLLLWGPPLLLALVFCFLMDNIGARIIVGCSIFITQLLLILFSLLNRHYQVGGRGKYLLSGGLCLMICVLAIRILSVAFAPDSISSMLRDTAVQILTFMGTFITLILISNGFVLMIKERADERVRLMAMKDRLTGAWNRIRLEESAQQEIARLERYGHPVSLIMVDLDHFKQINDQFGHATGDVVLREFCAVAQGCIRNTDVLARWGGEEFLILLPNSGFASAAPLAERIRAAVERHDFGNKLRVTVSMGVAVCQSTDTWESLLDRADKALYRAKTTGRNRVENECLQQECGQTAMAGTHLLQLVWRKAYESGNALIDSQHRALFDHANTLLDAIMDNQPKPEIARVIAALVAEIDQHFHDEEVIFRQAAYPNSEHHHELHSHLISRASLLSSRFEKDQVGAGELFHFLAYDVVAQHMLIEDRKFFPLLGT